MASPISAGEAIEIVRNVIALYNKIKHDVPEQIAKTGKRMSRLEVYLVYLEEAIKDKTRQTQVLWGDAATIELKRIIKDIRDDSKIVYAILEKWDKSIGPFGWEMRFATPAKAWFSISSSPEQLEALDQSIDEHKKDLNLFLTMIGYKNQSQAQSLQPNQQSNVAARSPSPAPPAAPGKKFDLIFVDPHNTGRSVVGEAYIALLKEWTVRTGGNWPVNKAHSAGTRVTNKGDVSDILQGIQSDTKMATGNALPVDVALASLFDNPLFNWPYKVRIQKSFEGHRSRGITHNIFQFDFILVFMKREVESLLALKHLLVAKFGKSIAPRGKGHILHLGAYLATTDGKPKNIYDPAKKNGAFDRSNWNWTTNGNIKPALKKFLKDELSWKEPPKGQVQN